MSAGFYQVVINGDPIERRGVVFGRRKWQTAQGGTRFCRVRIYAHQDNNKRIKRRSPLTPSAQSRSTAPPG
mgnify:CR=1 FL=1|jgi:hypothetical protein